MDSLRGVICKSRPYISLYIFYAYMGKTKNWGNFVASKMAVR